MIERYIARRTATALFLAALGLMLAAAYVGLVYYENTIEFGAEQVIRLDLFQWVVLFSIMLGLILVALLVLYFTPVGTTVVAVAAPETAEFIEEPAPAYSEADFAPTAEPVMEAETEALVVKCTNCETEFELPYSKERPLRGTCPNCGEEAVLEEPEEILERIGPAVIDLEGIGPKYADQLSDAGIKTTDQLRLASAERLAKQTGIPITTIKTWQAMADLVRVKGIGKQYAELLMRAGIETITELGRETPEHLVDRVEAYLSTVDVAPTKAKLDEKKAKKFITAARNLTLDKEFAERL